MRQFLCLTIGAALLCAAFLMTQPSATAQKAGSKPYRHVVLFKFKDDAPASKVDEIVKAFSALPSKLPAIQSFEWGTNVSPEKHDQGFTHCFTLTFASKEELEKRYLNEPAHKDFGAMLKGALDKVLVVDYVAN